MSVIVAAGLVLTLSVGVGAAVAADLPPGGTFADDDGSVHEGFIEAIAREGITAGCGGDRFCPSRDVTRGEIAAFLRRSLKVPLSGTDFFPDDDGHQFEDDINALAAQGIARGCRGGAGFCPDDEVTRGQIAAFIRRADRIPLTSTDYFVDDDGTAFEADINAIAAENIARGCNPPDNTRYCPTRTTERDQMASFLGRFLDLVPTPPPPRPAPEPAPDPAPDPGDMSVSEGIRAWFPDVYDDAVTVARCESGLDPAAVNPSGYYGLFQIGSYYHRSSFENVTGQTWGDAILTPYYNAQYARHLYDQSGWRAWSCQP